jgi:hypothetical protein
MLNRSGARGHPCLILDFRGNDFNFSPLRMVLAVGLSYTTFIMLRYIPSIPSFLGLLSWSGVGSCQRLFLHLFRWSSGFVFASINVLYYIYRFAYVEPPQHPWDEADLVMVYSIFDVFLDSVCHYFIEDFCTDVH